MKKVFLFFIIAVVSLGVGVFGAYVRDLFIRKSGGGAVVEKQFTPVSTSPSPSFRECGNVAKEDDVMNALEFGQSEFGGKLKVTKLPPLSDTSRESLACYYNLLANCENGRFGGSEGYIIIKPIGNSCSFAMLDPDKKGLECIFPPGAITQILQAGGEEEQIKNAPANLKEAYQAAYFSKVVLVNMLLSGLAAGEGAQEISLELENGQKINCQEKK